jgi:hypothetical protein
MKQACDDAAMKMPVVSVLLIFVTTAFAQDVPVPKMFRGMEGQKGQYQVEILEGGRAGAAKAPVMTLCTDNLMNSASERAKPRAESDCKHRLLKDTANEAVMESVCKERTTTVTMKREGKSMLMDISSTGPRGPQTMKMRYTHLGPCREGQGTVTFDKNSEQCRQMKEAAAKMDPAKQCARQKSDRETCEQRVRDAAAQLSAMCG